MIVVVSAMLAAALYPIVQRLHKKLPLTLSAVLVVLTLLLPLILIGAAVFPGLVRQFPDIINSLNEFINHTPWITKYFKNIDLNQYADNAGNYLFQSRSFINNVQALQEAS